MSESELSWLAGVFEGEGCIGIHALANIHRARSYNLRIELSNTDSELVTPYHQHWLGSFRERPAAENKQKVYQWYCVGWFAERFLRHMLPYFRSQRVRRKAALALEFQQQKSYSPRVNSTPSYKSAQLGYYEQMKTFNLRGKQKNENVLCPDEIAAVA